LGTAAARPETARVMFQEPRLQERVWADQTFTAILVTP
jgi:hypothetical protein